ncbi:SH3 domain-containing protein [Sphingobacterium sp. lm-10]|uniref:SH3 domain-containing protein n=1 Tax=Sphingobacterium sp. lm-10 TaxID=2944904 RepID=UPI00202215BE|nr:SH3 domain-containing protein [Sphingobacterium sp. lm-10]MCL7986995.1 SH3 domain-containing protein [Sphingobacterium sp. lm-10]
MPLTAKYAALIDLLNSLKVDQLEIHEENDILHISGVTSSVDAKHKAWDLYNRIDPNYISDDLALELTVQTDEVLKVATVTAHDEPFIAVRRGPGVNQPVLAELKDGDRIDILGLTNQNWCLVKVADKTEGYCYIDYLSV